jgi:DNA polymerase III subunit gamma/tau
MRQALYRTYRPVKFSEVVGQNQIRTILQNQVKSGEIGHAYLFCGPKGTGKTSMARILARAVNCSNIKDGEPCGECELCQAFDKNQMFDLIEIDAASNRSIDNVRELISKVSLAPSLGKYKVYVVDEAHQLTKDAANALLKTLEEPPSHVIFVLATTEAEKLISTIVSRCQRFDFHHLTTVEIADWLTEVAKREKIKIERDAIEFIAYQSSGGMRDALSLLDQVRLLGDNITREQIASGFGLVDFNEVLDLTKLTTGGDAGAALAKLDDLHKNGFEMPRLISAWANLMRQLLTIKLGNGSQIDLTVDQKAELKQVADNLNVGQLVNWLELLLTAMKETKTAAVPQLPVEIAIVKMASRTIPAEVKNEPALSDNNSKISPEPVRPKPLEQKNVAEELAGAAMTVWPENPAEIWTRAIGKIREASPTLAAAVSSAKPEFSDRGLILKFGQNFHCQSVQQTRNREIIISALAGLGVECAVRCELDSIAAAQAQPVNLANLSQVFDIAGE